MFVALSGHEEGNRLAARIAVQYRVSFQPETGRCTSG
jgi:hypothetical protein